MAKSDSMKKEINKFLYFYRFLATVNIDLGHTSVGPTGPRYPHIGYQTGGKRRNKDAVRGHILLDDVPYNR